MKHLAQAWHKVSWVVVRVNVALSTIKSHLYTRYFAQSKATTAAP